jgi:hypothetical protein
MDGGSSMNILYEETFKRMRMPRSMLHPTTTVFYVILPGRKASRIGQVNLEVAFGIEAKEMVCFKDVDL